ncbi:hypothetical protein ACLKA7_010550 [Drosophila subpalustris]
MDKTICAIVEYEYAAKEPDELDLQKGAIIHRIKQMPGGWWQGTLKASGITGMFPDNFVRILEPNSNGNHSDDSAVVQLREKSATSNRRCKVIYSYTQVNDDELTLAVGDVIEFLGEVEEGWWRGRLRSKVGVFPSNFVQHIEPSPILASKRPPTIGATVTTSSLTAKAANIAVANTTTTATPATAAPAIAAATTTTATTTAKQQTKSRAMASTVDATTAAAAAAAATATAAVPTLPPKPQRDFCRVEFPYAPQNEDELELKVDDIISVISMELPDKGWWKGELRGKVGVFPDNFVKLLAPSDVAPINEPTTTTGTTTTSQQSQRKISNTSHMTTTNASNSSGTTTVTQQQQQQQQQSSASSTVKVYIKKTGGSSSNSSTSGRKESFGSRDSLNDILSETGLPIGTVAAQRKSLENKNLDLSKLPGKTATTSNNSSSNNSNTNSSSSNTNIPTSAYADLRKSLDNMDEKMKSPPPPVLSKKPSVPLKKTPTGSVTGNILSGSGGGMKKKSSDSKLTSAVSHDVSDGLAGSKLSGGQLPESGVAGNVVMRRAATIAVEDTDFDRVERGSILQDMRAGRVKAPKRRPPSAAINVLGESNNNSVYVNGSGMASSASELSEDGGIGGGKQATASSDDNSTGEEQQLVKPKPRDWEKKKAPWMEELKASQVTRKKTSPSVEPRGGAVSVAERTSKLFAAEQTTVTATSTSSVLTTSATSSTSTTSSNTTATKVQSSAVTSSSILQQSMIVESSSSSSSQRKESSSSSSISTSNVTSNNNHNDAIMSKSMSSTAKVAAPTSTAIVATAASSDEESRVARPNSLSIRNRSVSPLVKSGNVNSTATQEKINNISAQDSSTNNHQTAAAAGATTVESTPRVQQLECRVDKLEAMVLTQQRTIEELIRTLREETERVKLLRGELDKYAQQQTRRGKFDNWMF